MNKPASGKAVKRLRRGGPRMFRSFEEFRAHFFPKEWEREQQRAEVETILDEAKFDRPIHKRQLTDQQIDDHLSRKMGLAE